MTRRWWGLVLAGVVGTGLGLVADRGVDVGAATTKTYIRTYTGTDFHTLDARLSAEVVPNSGGSVYLLVAQGQNVPEYPWLEKNIDLPTGARVIEVDFYYRYCGQGDNAGRYSFAAYSPRAGSSQFLLPAARPSVPSDCSVVRTFARTGGPIATVGASKRYSLGVIGDIVTSVRDASPTWTLVGARIKYTCDATCR